MTPNLSLELSLRFQNLLRTNLLQQISEDFPFEKMAASFAVNEKLHQEGSNKQSDMVSKVIKERDRVYSDENVLLTMLATAVQQDKSLQQSVNIFSKVYESGSLQIQQMEMEQLAVQKQSDQHLGKKMGRPRLYHSKLPKSKTRPISTSTAGLTIARQRLRYGLVKEVFNYSKDFGSSKQSLWHGMEAYNTDGTYLQLQDSEALRKKYYVRQGDGAYPQALLQAIVCHGSGKIADFEIGTRHQSELELIAHLTGNLPVNSLLLADDLYNSYAIFCLMQKRACHLIVPGKRDRNYTVVKQVSPGDEIVQLTRTPQPLWWKEDWQMPKTILMRRLSYLSPIDGTTEWILYTTLLDDNITKSDIILKYACRWDIEITIREIKTLMDINIIRSKSEDMVFKEITIALSAYNIVRKMIEKSAKQADFPPQKDIFQELSENYKNILVDKKGRVYQRWSPGRYGKVTSTDS